MASVTKHVSRLRDARVLMIGGSSGIGYAIAEALIEHDALVTIASSSETRIKSAVESLQKTKGLHGRELAGYTCDLSNEETIEDIIGSLFRKTGSVDHVVITSGDALTTVPVQELTTEVIHRAGRVRFLAPVLVAKHAAQHLNKSSKSSITFTGGVLSDKPLPGWSMISAFAAAMEGATRGLAIDLKPIRVNIVRPGMTDTNLYAASGVPDEMKQGIFADAAQKLPLGKVGRPEDLAEAYLYLMKDENVTGEVLNSNGGQLLV